MVQNPGHLKQRGHATTVAPSFKRHVTPLRRSDFGFLTHANVGVQPLRGGAWQQQCSTVPGQCTTSSGGGQDFGPSTLYPRTKTSEEVVQILDLQLVFVFSLCWRDSISEDLWCRILDLQLVFSHCGGHNGRDPSEELQEFGPNVLHCGGVTPARSLWCRILDPTCFCFLTVVAPMLTRENEGSKKSVRKVVQDFVHQQSRATLQILLVAFVLVFCAYFPCHFFAAPFVVCKFTILAVRDKGCCEGSTQCSTVLATVL